MVVTFHLERHCPIVANVDHAGILFSGLYQNAITRSREFHQLGLRVLVRTMLAPHHGEYAELGEVRLAPKNTPYALILLRSKAVLGDKFRSEGRLWHGIFNHRGRREHRGE